MTATELATRLHAKPAGEGWLAKCPGHEDQRASLSVGQGSDGRTLLKCHAGCSLDAIMARAGLVASDLFLESSSTKSSIVATYDYTDEFDVLLYQAVRIEPKDFLQRRPDEGQQAGPGSSVTSVASSIDSRTCGQPPYTSRKARRMSTGSCH